MGVAGTGWGFIQSQRADGLANLYDLNLQPLGGDVGIGTTSPGEKLTVAGNISITSPNSFLVKNGDSNHGLKYGYNTFASNPTDGPILYGYDAGGLGTTRNSENIVLYWNYLGNVGIGTTTPVSYKLDVNGTGRFTSTVTATNFILSSDETLKDNIKEIDTKHVDVDWKNFELKSEPGIKRAGVIAQELEIKHPEFVRTAVDGLKSVAYIDLLITKIAELEARLEKLEK